MKKNTPKFLLLLLLWLGSYSLASACSCNCDVADFSICEILREDNQSVVLQAILYEIKEDTYDYYERYQLRVLDQLAGPSIGDTVYVDVDNVCNEPLLGNEGWGSIPNLGDTLVFVAGWYDTDSASQIPIVNRFTCEALPMSYRDGWVEGPFNARFQNLALADLKTYLQSDLYNDPDCLICNCGCFNYPFPFAVDNFCTVVNLPYWEVIVHARVEEEVAEHGFRLRINSILRGEGNGTNELVMWTAPVKGCRSTGEGLEIGEDYIFALSELEFGDLMHSDEQPGDYELLDCGPYYLPVVNGEVVGPVTPLIERIDLNEFTDLVRTFDSFMDCDFGIDVEEAKIVESQIDVFPNPTNGLVTITVPATFATNAQLRLYNTNGQLIYSGPFPYHTNGQIDLNEYTKQQGVFLIEVTNQETSSIQKIIKT